MKTLEELRKTTFPVPCLFAAEGCSDILDVSTDEERDDFSMSNGFGSSYSQDVGEGKQGRYILCDEFNAFGEIASAEALFKQAGGLHTYNKNVAEDFSGYPEGASLLAFDGEYIAKVESSEASNQKAFADDNGVVIPNVINCAESANDSRILWRSVSHLAGIGDSIFHLDLDYTNIKEIKNGEVIEQDSLLIGECICDEHVKISEGIVPLYYGEYLGWLFTFAHTTNLSGATDISFKYDNKGLCGIVAGTFPAFLDWPPIDCPVPRCLGGTGNYAITIFVKAGTTISISAVLSSAKSKKRDISDNVHLSAIPIRPQVVTA